MDIINQSNTKHVLTGVSPSGVTFREAKFRFTDEPENEDQVQDDGATDWVPGRAKEPATDAAGTARVRRKGVVNGI